MTFEESKARGSRGLGKSGVGGDGDGRVLSRVMTSIPRCITAVVLPHWFFTSGSPRTAIELDSSATRTLPKTD